MLLSNWVGHCQVNQKTSETTTYSSTFILFTRIGHEVDIHSSDEGHEGDLPPIYTLK